MNLIIVPCFQDIHLKYLGIKGHCCTLFSNDREKKCVCERERREEKEKEKGRESYDTANVLKCHLGNLECVWEFSI